MINNVGVDLCSDGFANVADENCTSALGHGIVT